MADEKEVLVAVINQGGGKYSTSRGELCPKSGISLPEAEAKKLCGYRDVVLASSVVDATGDAALAKENAGLKAQVAELLKKLGAPDDKDAQIAELQGKVDEFLKAKTKADLTDLQEKHGPTA
jgi:hypothetical protein